MRRVLDVDDPSSAYRPVCPRTSTTSPSSHWSRSSVWIAWLIRTPPPLSRTLPAPRPGLVVRRIAVPQQRGRRRRAPGPARPSRAAASPPARRVVAVLQADPDLDAGMLPVAAAISRSASADRVGDRLLDQDADAGVEAVDRHRDVLVVRGADVHDLGAYRLEQLRMVGEPRHAVLLARRGGPVGVGVADADQVDAVEVRDRRQVDDRYRPAPDHGARRSSRHFTPPAVRPPIR